MIRVPFEPSPWAAASIELPAMMAIDWSTTCTPNGTRISLPAMMACNSSVNTTPGPMASVRSMLSPPHQANDFCAVAPRSGETSRPLMIGNRQLGSTAAGTIGGRMTAGCVGVLATAASLPGRSDTRGCNSSTYFARSASSWRSPTSDTVNLPSPWACCRRSRMRSRSASLARILGAGAWSDMVRF